MGIAVFSKTNVYPQINKNNFLHTFFTYILITDNTYHVKTWFLYCAQMFSVIFSAQPIFTNDNTLTQYSDFGEKAIITVYVYSVPKYSTSSWYKSNTQVPPSTKYAMSERPAIVNDIFHGKTIQLDGYSVMLTINDLKESDFNYMYTLKLSYGASQTVQYSVSLKTCGK